MIQQPQSATVGVDTFKSLMDSLKEIQEELSHLNTALSLPYTPVSLLFVVAGKVYWTEYSGLYQVSPSFVEQLVVPVYDVENSFYFSVGFTQF